MHSRLNSSLSIRGGYVIDPLQRLEGKYDLLLKDGRVAEIAGPGKLRSKADETFDARGLLVCPGLIDIHVHLREPGQTHKETIATGTMAAAAGGFTSVCCMPNTVPVNDSAEITRWMQDPARGAHVNVFPIAAATIGSMGEQTTDFASLKKAGAVAVTDDGKPILNEAVMRQSLLGAGKLGIPVIQHAEDTRMTAGAAMHAGAAAFRLGLRGWVPEAESSLVERDIRLAAETKAHYHVAHLSTSAALKAVRKAKRDRLRVTCEVTPHHFALIDENVGDYDTNFKMNPPLRTPSDVEALLAGLADGSIDCIATDHAPHACNEKNQEFDRAPFGITGLETALGLCISILHQKHKMPMRRIIELLSTNPARVMKLEGRGTLARGAHADLTIFDPGKKWTYHAAQSHSKSKNSPFDGWHLQGKVMATVVGGMVKFPG
ncbi:MAG TPA: dihydroorotase [Candidatus Limnocylindrales bacterium]|nr:dihydroorotase [Candidatus Limnocylindrales bacterium]